MDINYDSLASFFASAATSTYAGGAGYVPALRPGFNEMEYKQNEWSYRDSFIGYFKSWGQETVYYRDKPVWVQHYGGGMESQYVGNKDFAEETFSFLKQALFAGKKVGQFTPRGPKEFVQGAWKYVSGFRGVIAKFQGSEEIFYNNKLVFTHSFFGGIAVEKGV